MKPTDISLPGIKYIGWLDCNNLLPHVALRGICGMEIPILAPVTEMPFSEAECSCKSEYVNNGQIENATLKFKSTERLPSNVSVGFVVVDVNGTAYLIGQREKPHPVVSFEQRLGSPDSESSITEYEIKLQAYKALVRCII